MTPVLAALTLALAQTSAPVSPDLGELLALRAGDAACSLFDAPERALLDAAIARSRDDRVRAGADPAALTGAAPAPACSDPDLARLSADHLARIDALSGYTELSFPGVTASWRVDRTPRRATSLGPIWRVAQRHTSGQAWFGVYDTPQGPAIGIAFNADTRAARAVLAFRDPARQAHPIDFTAEGLLEAPDGDPAAAWGAGARAQRRVSAAARMEIELAQALAPAGGAPARGFIFPDAVLTQLSNLTPREGVAVELYDPAGRVEARYWFEIGALKAGLAMQALPINQPEPLPAAAEG